MIIPSSWTILKRSNIVIFDEMGYPLRLFIVSEEIKGLFGRVTTKISQRWIDIDISCYDENIDVICEWR